MVTTAPPPEMATEKAHRPANESRAATDGRNLRAQQPENNGSAEPGSPARRGKRRRNARGSESPSSVQRFFLTKNGSNGIPELDREVDDENTGRTYSILCEWRPTVDNTTKGRPLITKQAVSKDQ